MWPSAGRWASKCIITEKTLRSFCRAVGPDTPVTRIRLKAVAKFLAGTGPITRTWHFKYSALKGLFQFAVSRGHLDKVPLADGTAQVPTRHSSRTFTHAKNFAACWTRSRRTMRFPCARVEPHTLRAMLLLLYGAGLRRGEALRLTARRRGFSEFLAHHSRYQVLQVPAGSHQPGS